MKKNQYKRIVGKYRLSKKDRAKASNLFFHQGFCLADVAATIGCSEFQVRRFVLNHRRPEYSKSCRSAPLPPTSSNSEPSTAPVPDWILRLLDGVQLRRISDNCQRKIRRMTGNNLLHQSVESVAVELGIPFVQVEDVIMMTSPNDVRARYMETEIAKTIGVLSSDSVECEEDYSEEDDYEAGFSQGYSYGICDWNAGKRQEKCDITLASPTASKSYRDGCAEGYAEGQSDGCKEEIERGRFDHVSREYEHPERDQHPISIDYESSDTSYDSPDNSLSYFERNPGDTGGGP